MSNVETLLADLRHTASFLTSQTESGMCVSFLQTAQTNAFSAKIAQLKDLTMEKATEVTTVITGGPWTPEQESVLLKAVQNRMNSSPGGNVGRENQKCQKFQLYIKQSRVDRILSPKTSQWGRIVEIKEAAFEIGLGWPDEHTAARMACIVQVCTPGCDTTSTAWMRLLQEFSFNRWWC